jgi:hypothetical protein
VVRPASRPIPRVGRYSRSRPTRRHAASPTGLSPAPAARSSGVRLRRAARRGVRRPLRTGRPTPGRQRQRARCAARVWAPPRSLAATGGILSLPPGTEMFQFPGCPPHRSAVTGYDAGRVAPFGHPRIAGCQRLPGAFRRVAASFLGRRRLGIHRAPSSAASPARPPAPRSPRDPATGAAPGQRRDGGRAVRGGRVLLDPSFRASCVLRGSWCVWCRCRGEAPRSPTAAGPWSVPRARLSRCIAGRGRKTGAAARGGAGGPRWSRGDSNPGPPPCKGGALPAKLRPPVRGDRERSPADGSLVLPSPVARRPARWARLDSNQGPRPYQGRALTA